MTIGNDWKKAGRKRIVFMMLGNVLIAMGVSIFKLAQLGNDAYNGMAMALADAAGIPYAAVYVVCSGILFVIELLAGRRYVGIGTLFNTFLNGLITTFFFAVWTGFFGCLQHLGVRIFAMLAGVAVVSLGLSLYQRSDVGVSPYDSMPLILAGRFPKIPYFGWRILADGTCALICFLAGGLVGIGMLAAALGLGPVVHFFDRCLPVHFPEKEQKQLRE